MPSTISILQSLKNKYPQFKFEPSDDFSWSASVSTIYYDEKSPDIDVFLLHELSHALLGHDHHDQDIQLVTMERQAWDHTVALAPAFGVAIPDNIVQSTLDSYRDWMHSRSACPKCDTTGVQTDKNTYKCLACNESWRVNIAKTCALRRYTTKKRS
ncbi:MAG: hypothetical protein WCI79_03500 [Candidatus Saccharibacteria bacterium]